MAETQFRNAVVIGTGQMGPGIAGSLALGGVRTALFSRTEENAKAGLARAREQLALLATHGLITPAQNEAALPLLSATAKEDVFSLCDLVIESAPEDMKFKQDLFSKLGHLTLSGTVLASNTSGLSITEIARHTMHPERVLTTHFWNPPHLMPLVEVVLAEKTDRVVGDQVFQLLKACGKVPVLVKQDRPGQLGNRLQMALVREAVNIVQEGIADAESVDLAARAGFGLRLPAYGILEHQDIVGLELGSRVVDYVTRDLNNEPGAPALYREKLARGELGVKSGKGFYDWSHKSVKDVIARRDNFLIDFLKRYRFDS